MSTLHLPVGEPIPWFAWSPTVIDPLQGLREEIASAQEGVDRLSGAYMRASAEDRPALRELVIEAGQALVWLKSQEAAYASH